MDWRDILLTQPPVATMPKSISTSMLFQRTENTLLTLWTHLPGPLRQEAVVLENLNDLGVRGFDELLYGATPFRLIHTKKTCAFRVSLVGDFVPGGSLGCGWAFPNHSRSSLFGSRERIEVLHHGCYRMLPPDRKLLFDFKTDRNRAALGTRHRQNTRTCIRMIRTQQISL